MGDGVSLPMVLRLGLAVLHAPHTIAALPPMQPAVASWYDDAGATASGRHYPLGFAALILGNQWGRRVLFCHADRCAVGQLDDHGPYIAGRTFDLNPQLRATLACPDLCLVTWRPVR
jgi:hypothetical protein